MSASKRKCGSCRHWKEEVPAYDYDDPEDVLGTCSALRPPDVPYAWRWAWREVVWTRAGEPPDGEPCALWKPHEPEAA